MSECQICEAETEYEYCLKCTTRAVVQWMPGWVWVGVGGGNANISWSVNESNWVVSWKDIIKNRNIWQEVEQEIVEDCEVLNEYYWNLIEIVRQTAERNTVRDAMWIKMADSKDCLKAFAKTEPIQSILEDMDDVRGKI